MAIIDLFKRRPRKRTEETFYHAVKATPWLEGIDETPEFGFRNFLKTSMDPCPHEPWWTPCPEGTTNETCLYFKCALAECGCRFHFRQPGDPRFIEASATIMKERSADYEGREARCDTDQDGNPRRAAPRISEDWQSARWADNND